MFRNTSNLILNIKSENILFPLYFGFRQKYSINQMTSFRINKNLNRFFFRKVNFRSVTFKRVPNRVLRDPRDLTCLEPGIQDSKENEWERDLGLHLWTGCGI